MCAAPCDPSVGPTFADLSQAIATAGIHAFRWEIATDRVAWSEGVEALLGQPPGGHDGRFESFLALIPAQDRDRVRAAIDRALRGETPAYAEEHRVCTRAGETRWIECKGNVFRDANGKPTRMVGLVSDVTARKETDARVAQQGLLSSVVRAINKQILHVETERELFDAACRIAVELGRFRFAWVGRVASDGVRVEPVARFGHEDGYLASIVVEATDTPAGRGPVGTAVREGRVWVTDDVAEDPRFVPWREAAMARGYRSCAGFPLRRGGRVIGALVVYAGQAHLFDDEQIALLRDLADDMSYALDIMGVEERRRAAEIAMRASEERYRTLFAQAVEGIVLVDADYRIADANESACRMLGYTLAGILGLPASAVVDPADIAAAPLRFSTIPAGGVILSDRRFRRKDGTNFPGEVSTKALADGTYQCVIRDVTKRKQLEAQLLLTDRMTSLGRLASGVAHEVNNPLAYVMLNLELVARKLASLARVGNNETIEVLERAIADARDGADRMRRIVRTLSTFGRGDEEKTGPVDVGAVLDSAAEIAAMQLRHRGRLVRQYDARAMASANEFQLGQVFVNLLVNASDALREGDPANEIRLRTFVRDADTIVVEVCDNGVGIPLEVQGRIFDPFFTTKPIGRGTGLGLSVCHALVTSFGGSIACESVPGKGTTFWVALPISHATSRPERESRARASDVRGRVLVVDDDPRVASAVAAALEGHDVTVASSGREALELCASEVFDCILCDLMMPEVTGMDVYESLRREERGMEKRVVFMTGGAMTEHARAFVTRAASRVLEKPIAASELCAVVASAVEAARAKR